MIAALVDDVRANLLIYEHVLARIAGIQTRSFTSSADALAWCEVTEPDLLVIDYRMPTPNGIEFIQQYRIMRPESETPIIMITGDFDRSVKNRALELGATDFLKKPTDPVELQARARNLLALRESRRKLQAHAHSLKEDIARAVADITAREEETIHRLMRAAEFRDETTGQHIVRLGHYAAAMGQALGMNAEEQRQLLLATPMHDIGKVAIPDSILLKPGRLTAAEMDIMRHHAEAGYDILKGSNSKVLQMAADIALGHHEKWDGSGYPNGIRGESIPLSARVCAVSDVFDALTSDRPYKYAWTVERAFAEIQRLAGLSFDPKLVALFFEIRPRILTIKEQFADDPVEVALARR
ncbi:two-component system response regulator [Vulcanimicrobium alpinum]|uniref:Two-component system response regulator n=1 Tax=Vulcanimicrobium alpinum TaxID=3016050 RepID=A0AAN1XTY8_UNVUL|nr:HD domain-containing phosphohydrolase [Vulcanimicrobium alpinum]BDE05064.1 two-component system response regulator [Vulcanimicrobium alpinum]